MNHRFLLSILESPTNNIRKIYTEFRGYLFKLFKDNMDAVVSEIESFVKAHDYS